MDKQRLLHEVVDIQSMFNDLARTLLGFPNLNENEAIKFSVSKIAPFPAPLVAASGNRPLNSFPSPMEFLPASSSTSESATNELLEENTDTFDSASSPPNPAIAEEPDSSKSAVVENQPRPKTEVMPELVQASYEGTLKKKKKKKKKTINLVGISVEVSFCNSETAELSLCSM